MPDEENTAKKPKRPQKADASDHPECFLIMPMSDPVEYNPGHFLHIYNDIFVPACAKAGFHPIRADKNKESNLIHLDILQKLLDSPMCMCDLSSHNPNVLFELGLRQAFDKPVALVQESGTKPIFDIAPLRYTEYRKGRVYDEVLEDQRKIADTLKETFEAHQQGKGINSIVRLLSLEQAARLVKSEDIDRQADYQKLILAEMEQMRNEFRSTMRAMQDPHKESSSYAHVAQTSDDAYINNLGSAVDHFEEMVKGTQSLGVMRSVEFSLQNLKRVCKEHQHNGLSGVNYRRLVNTLYQINGIEMSLHKSIAELECESNTENESDSADPSEDN